MGLEPFMQLISFSGWLLLDKGSFLRYCCNGPAGNEVWQIKYAPLGATLSQLAAVTLSITVGTLLGSQCRMHLGIAPNSALSSPVTPQRGILMFGGATAWPGAR